MPKKKDEELIAAEETIEAEEAGDAALETPADEAQAAVEAAPADEAPAAKKPRKAPAKKAAAADTATEEPSVIEDVLETVAAAAETVVEAVSAGASALVSAVTGSDEQKVHKGKRAEKIGVVASDKMTKTVTVRVDRLVKHPVYRKYIRKRKKFMAHDELGSKIGDKVRIVETRPLSARKRWRVVEIIQKAEL